MLTFLDRSYDQAHFWLCRKCCISCIFFCTDPVHSTYHVYVLDIPRRWGVYGLYIHEARGHYAPKGECVYNPYTPKRRGISNIYTDWAFICSHGRMRKMVPSSWNHSLAMIGLFTLAITNESSVRRNQVQRRRCLMHAAFAYVSVAIRSAPVTTVPVVVSVRTIVNCSARRVLAWIRNGRRGKSVPLQYWSIHHHMQVKDAVSMFWTCICQNYQKMQRQRYLLPSSFAS